MASPVPGLEFPPGPAHAPCGPGYGIVSFTLDGIRSTDLGFVLAQHGFLVRTGAHCVPPASDDAAEADSVRVSTHIYNTADEIDRFIRCVSTLARRSDHDSSLPHPATTGAPPPGCSPRWPARDCSPGRARPRARRRSSSPPPQCIRTQQPPDPVPAHVSGTVHAAVPSRSGRTATHRIAWTDSDGIPNTGHYRADGLGPLVPIAMRETVLVLWHAIDANTGLAERISALATRSRDAGRHDDRPRADRHLPRRHRGRGPSTGPARPACQLRRRIAPRSNSPLACANPASSPRWPRAGTGSCRPRLSARDDSGDFLTQPDGTVRYSAETVATLRAMKDATIADAHTVMRRATPSRAFSPAALAKYHDDLDLISRQYALLPAGTRPACLAAMPHHLGGGHYSILPVVVDQFVAVFVATLANRCSWSGGERPDLAREHRRSGSPRIRCSTCRI